MRWANGGGSTREIVAGPDPGEWSWRLSIADVDSSGPFSPLPGVLRTIALLHGHGFILRVGGASSTICDPFLPFLFDGADATTCELIDGPVLDLNLMERGPKRTLDLQFMSAAAGARCTVGGARVVVVVAGKVTSGRDELDVFDALVGSAAQISPVSLDAGPGGAVLAVVSSAR